MDPPLSESIMRSLLKKENIEWGDFLGSIWEKKCHRFAFGASKLDGNLWGKMVDDGWEILTFMLDNTHPMRPNTNNTDETSNAGNNCAISTTIGEEFPPPLLFRDLHPMDDPEEIQQLFGTSLYAAYLAGSSIIWNHVDLISPRVAALCEDLQQPFHFPHAYANAYLTPPLSQTVPAHADDRDVLVFQLVGRKRWKVYERIPVHHPYPHEQVGKAGMAVPESVLNGPLAFDGCLSPGDVLYLPRGMVHEAGTFYTSKPDQPPDLSFHITVALATHDWTLGGNLSRILQTKLLEDTATLRRSLLPAMPVVVDSKETPSNGKSDFVSCGGSLVDAKALQEQLDSVFENLRSQITADSILNDMNHRIETHNKRATEKRLALAAAAASSKKEKHETDCESNSTIALDRVVGPLAAKSITLETVVKASTMAEKEHALQQFQGKPGLTVRDGVGNDVAHLVAKIKFSGLIIRVEDFRADVDEFDESSLCDLTALSLAKRAVELGAFRIVESTSGSDNNTAAAAAAAAAMPNPKRRRTQPPL